MNSSTKKGEMMSPIKPTSAHEEGLFLSDAQLRAEFDKCEFCEDKPCQEACPADCSPADFIKAALLGDACDFQRSAALIMGKNPLGGVCGMVCPDKFCMAACVHKKLDGAVKIPAVQATIIHQAKQLGVMPTLAKAPANGKKVAVIGSGPAGLGAAVLLTQRGYTVTIFERQDQAGGMCLCIPDFRLDKSVLASDIEWALKQGDITLELNSTVGDPKTLLEQGFCAVIGATGLWSPIALRVPGEAQAIKAVDLLQDSERFDLKGNVAVIGGGATAFDCAMTAAHSGARHVEMFALETLGEMPLTRRERHELMESGIDVSGRTRVTEILAEPDKITGITTEKVSLKEGASFSLKAILTVADSAAQRRDINTVIIAIGLTSDIPRIEDPRIFYAGDCAEGPTTVVEGAAAGKNAAEAVDRYIKEQQAVTCPRNESGHLKSRLQIEGYNFTPVSLECDFFGRTLTSPFLLSAAPPTDGLEQMRKAYAAGWAGGIMKTAFDGIPIHIPSRYMFSYDSQTYANCDNVSGHDLQRVCREVTQLVKEFPDQLTAASTGGPVSGDDEADQRQWLSNTRMLEEAGAMAIEYSLSCPQGGDGTEGDIVSQNAALSAKIIEWVLAGSAPEVPKIFKLTGAVTSIPAIVAEIKKTFDKYPQAKAGITLANSFPTLAFRPGNKESWDEGIILGASGAGILNISYLSLAKVAHLGVHVSGNGGPMDYRAAANFLALGTRTVQFCTLVMKEGYGVIDQLCSGLSHFMAHRNIASVEQLIGRALPEPVTDFMDLSPDKMVSSANPELCLQCGNCARCPYLAISSNSEGFPETDPARCVGCSICALKCFAQAITMRQRTAEEAAALKED